MPNRRVSGNPFLLTELIPLFKHQLALCNLQPRETCLVVTDTAFNPLYGDACFGAALELGAEVVKLVLPAMGPLPEHALRSAMQAADLIVYSTTHTLHYSEAMREGLARGMRALMAVQPLHTLARLKGDLEVRARSRAGAQRLAKADCIQITSRAGTDLTMRRGNRPVLANYGLADSPGRLDFWGGGMVQTAPIEGTLEGQMVLDTGDLLFYLGRYVEQPVTITFEQGQIVNIKGRLDALLLRKTLESYQDENAWKAGHIAWGTDRRALWTAQLMQFPEPGLSAADAESFYGNVQVEFGSNNDVAFQGKNVSSAHLGHCMLNCSVFLDDEMVIDHGDLVSSIEA